MKINTQFVLWLLKLYIFFNHQSRFNVENIANGRLL